MAVTVTFTDNLDEVLHLFKSAKSKALLDIGVTVEDDARDNSPRRTGDLQKSWTVEVNEGESYVKIGVPLGALEGDYAKYQELGTRKGVPARHMLRNAVQNNISQFSGIAEAHFHNA